MSVNRRRRLIPIAVGIVLVMCGWRFFRHNREPRYEGRPVSYWFREYCYANTGPPYHDDDEDKAKEAMRRIGTNAIPYLLRRALDTNEDSAWHKKFHRLFEEYPDTWHLPRLIDAEDSREQAAFAMQIINPPAGLVLPFVQSALSETNTLRYRQAVLVLSWVTNGAEMFVPYFAKAVHDSDYLTQRNALFGLKRIGPPAAAAIPDLVAALQKMDADQSRLDCAALLGQFGTNALVAIPVLTSHLINSGI